MKKTVKLEVYTWIANIIISCETVEQLLNCDVLISRFKQMHNNKDGWADLLELCSQYQMHAVTHRTSFNF